MKIQILILGIFTILRCTTKTGTQANYVNFEAAEAMPIERILHKSEVLHHFSSTIDKDTFRVIVTGQSFGKAKFRFCIIKIGGQSILDENYDTTMLLDYGLKSDPTEKDINEYVRDRIDRFFAEDNFHQPAISVTEVFDNDYSEKKIWDDIIADQTAVGFYYLIGEEDGRQIAFSKKLGKVVIYYNCC